MADQQQTPPPAGGSTTTPPAGNTTTTPPQTQEAPWVPDRKEWVDSQKLLRDMATTVKGLAERMPGPPATTPTTMTTTPPTQTTQQQAAPETDADRRVARLERKLAVKDVIAAFPGLTDADKELLESVGPDMSDEKRRALAKRLADANAAAGTQQQAAPPAGTAAPQTPAPTPQTRTQIPDDPSMVDPKVWAAMTPEERKRHTDNFKAKSGLKAPWL
jgi:hypothetical protein